MYGIRIFDISRFTQCNDIADYFKACMSNNKYVFNDFHKPLHDYLFSLINRANNFNFCYFLFIFIFNFN